MEVLVSCCVGALVMVSAGMALVPAGASAATPYVPQTAATPLESLCGMARRLGSALLGGKSSSVVPVARALGELRFAAWGRTRPLGSADDATLLGLVVMMSAVSGVVVSVVAHALPALPIGLALPSVVLVVLSSRRAHREAGRLEEAMPEAFGALAISLGSGHSLSQAMRYVGSHAEEPVRSEFMRVSFAVDCGISAVDALDAMLARLRAPGLDLVVLALKVSQRTGAPLKDLLAEATRMVSARIELRRMLDVKTSQARLSARLVACMPVGMLAVLSLISQDFRAGLAMPIGAASVALALVLNVAALVVIRKIMKVEL